MIVELVEVGALADERSPSKRNIAVIRQRNDRPVGGSARNGPRCVPSRSNSTITASSAWRSAISSLRWSGNAPRVSAKYARTSSSPSKTSPVGTIS